MRYYSILFSSSKTFGVARFNTEELLFLPADGPVVGWQPLTGTLGRGEESDYLASNLAFRICSARMRAILEELATPADVLQWLPVHVANSRAELREYHVLHFPAPPDVIDRDRSIIMDDDVIVKVLLCAESAARHAVFSYPGGGSTTFLVNGEVKKRLQKAGCTGIQFFPEPR
ncbi:MAG TPA: hypothetical protein VGQ83_35940 [Polyangia bacterium]